MNEQNNLQANPNEAAPATPTEQSALTDLKAQNAEEINGGGKVGAGHLILPNGFYGSGIYKAKDADPSSDDK